jgi:hypothetical protein
VLFGADGALVLRTSEPGRYEARLADGRSHAWTIAGAPRVQPLAGPWDVTFRQGSAPLFRIAFNELADWKSSADARVRYFSGTAVYETRFSWTAPAAGTRVWLDLGDVRNIAAVALNGRDVGVLWCKPFRADLTDALRAGENRLDVRVANDWLNRLTGDEQFPDDSGANAKGELAAWPDWVAKGQPRPEPRRVTLISRKQTGKDAPLRSSGLLGPVTVFDESSAP